MDYKKQNKLWNKALVLITHTLKSFKKTSFETNVNPLTGQHKTK